jgi:hypothetical protein
MGYFSLTKYHYNYDGFGFLPDSNDLERLSQTGDSGRRYAGNFRRSSSMAASPYGVEWKLLDGITGSFYHDSAPVNKEILDQ